MQIISQSDRTTFLRFNCGITAMTSDDLPENYSELELVSLDISNGYDDVGGLTATLSDGSKLWVKYLSVVDEKPSANEWVTLAETGIIDVDPEIIRKAIEARENFTQALSGYKREMEEIGMIETFDSTLPPQEYVYCVPGLSRKFLKFPAA